MLNTIGPEMLEALRRLSSPVKFVQDGGKWRPVPLISGGDAGSGAFLPPISLSALGDAAFCTEHGVGLPLYAGSMAHGIASEALVESMARAGMLGFYGAAGESPEHIGDTLLRLQQRLGGLPFGFNLINSPNDPQWEMAVARLYLRAGLRCVEASAYIALTPALVLYRVKGIHRLPDGSVHAPNRVIAKVSRTEIAERFFSPPPEKILRRLVEMGELTPEEAELAGQIPMARDVTGEADSGGHTDHRAAIAMLPSLMALRDAMQERYGRAEPLRVGLAGGIATPHAAAAAFAMGAAYVATGSINQACVESGSSETVRTLLAAAAQTDVGRAPAADMFEMGVTVQVLKKGTRFVERANLLYELYRKHGSLEELPADVRDKLEKDVFRKPLDEVWTQTAAFFAVREPRQLEKAAANPRHKMALVFRWYLGQSSKWANQGAGDRVEDYQIWCGPAMGAFNDWVRGSFMEEAGGRSAPVAAKNILFHAAVLQRAALLRMQGVPVFLTRAGLAPLDMETINRYVDNTKESGQ